MDELSQNQPPKPIRSTLLPTILGALIVIGITAGGFYWWRTRTESQQQEIKIVQASPTPGPAEVKLNSQAPSLEPSPTPRVAQLPKTGFAPAVVFALSLLAIAAGLKLRKI